VPIRLAQIADLPRIVEIYNASIPGRLATADTEPVTVEAREAWFREFDPAVRPLWVLSSAGSDVAGWLSLRSFYGRPAYRHTVEVAIYTDPAVQRKGVGRTLLDHALSAAAGLQIQTILAFVFAHNAPSLRLFAGAGFERWGHLPRVAVLDEVERDLDILGRRIA
jgi:L-amino acid N-acyltransferase YncA